MQRSGFLSSSHFSHRKSTKHSRKKYWRQIIPDRTDSITWLKPNHSNILTVGSTGCRVFKTKLERFLPKNPHTQKKLLNFENWVNWEVSKIGHHLRRYSDLKNVHSKKCAPKLIFFYETKLRKIRIIFDIENWRWKSEFRHFRQLLLNWPQELLTF